MSQAFTPRLYQTAITNWTLEHERCAVFAGMGMGKTCATLSSLLTLELVTPGPTLVLAPLRVATSTWPDEAAKWDHLSGLKVIAVVGDVDQRRASLRTRADVYSTNYEQLPWLVEHFKGKWPFTKVIADESTRLKSFRLRQGGKRARALASVAHTEIKHFIELTGTPAPNGLQDLWGQAWFLDRGERLGRTFTSFTDRWFKTNHSGFGVSPMPYAQTQIEDKLRDICLSLDARDYFDISAPIVHIIRVELPPKARRLYRDMESEMFLSIGEHQVEAFNAASRTIKCLQLANGSIYTDETSTQFEEIHDVKLQALDSIVEEASGAPIIVAYHFKADLARLKRTFPQGRTLDANPQTIRDWNAGLIPILFAHPESAGHGLNLQDGGNILVFFGHWWNLESYLQIIERIGPTRQAQAGHDRPVFVYHIVATDTVDELVMAARDSKRSVQELLLEALKRKK